ncbi:hypothetical protein [Tahibacter amnicola]|uniref:Uncharacterized protein n=1 Tax=Tahibacter amnicola TaxID=2976241 RepID=A0ABY6BGZ4_9GAMM|nr:hypothetical protein [Tahibacter amnicola]UXI68345.1 hypothetical protein N4264_01455 [Tahibacter amnicola]
MAKKRFVFAPQITITGSITAMIVAFDAASDDDTRKEPRLVRVPSQYRSLAVRCRGFDTVAQSSGRVEGTIELLVHPEEGEPQEPIVLADVSLPEMPDLRAQVEAGTTRAWSRALQDFCRGLGSGEAPAYAALPAAVHARALPPVEPRGSGLKMAGVTVAGIVVAIAAIAAVRNRAPEVPPGPPETLAARTLLADPATLDSSIALTQQTLKSMGLDPGTAADMACLAAPPVPKPE